MNLNNILKQAFKDNTNSQGVTFQPRFIDQVKEEIQGLMLREEGLTEVIKDFRSKAPKYRTDKSLVKALSAHITEGLEETKGRSNDL